MRIPNCSSSEIGGGVPSLPLSRCWACHTDLEGRIVQVQDWRVPVLEGSRGACSRIASRLRYCLRRRECDERVSGEVRLEPRL
jgi:hypothetical protein